VTRARPSWAADLGACAAAGALAGLGRGAILACEVLAAGGERPSLGDLVHLIARVAVLHLPLALSAGAAILLLVSAARIGRGGSGSGRSRGAALAWGIFVFLLVGGVAGDELALDDPLGVAHLGARAGALFLAIGAGFWRSARPIVPATARRSWSCVAAACALLPLSGWAARASLPPAPDLDPTSRSASPPDLLLLLVDTLRADHLGCYGYRASAETSPTLDSLATSGVLFERAYAQWTRTAPSHATLFSGRYPHQHGLIANGQRLPERLPLLAESLSEAGYRSVAFLSNPFLGRRYGFDRGFDLFVEASDLALAGSPPAAWLRRLPLIRLLDRLRDEEPVTAMAIEWLQRHPRGAGDAPRALVVQWVDPHMPYRPPRRLLRHFAPAPYQGELRGTRAQIDAINEGRLALDDADAAHMVARYDAEIRHVDDAIGRLLAAWRRAASGGSLVAMTADHGENMHEHSQSFRHPPHVHDSLARVPWLLSGDAARGSLPAGIRIDSAVELTDFGATVLDLLGVEAPAGESLAHLLARAAVDRMLGNAGAPRPGTAIIESADGSIRRIALVRGRWKVIREVSPGGTRDLLLHVGEAGETSAFEPDTLQALGAALDDWLAAQGDAAAELLLRPEPLAIDRLDERSIRALRALGYL